ncbi:hypothetical protein [Halioxenophilus aromaticivorans]|uniref:Uncharacterized protein n=1 Tax=Halioxenophilus aromaticivorans TaxID=1306992 RepID=A0AAV3U4M2_9ALTE
MIIKQGMAAGLVALTLAGCGGGGGSNKSNSTDEILTGVFIDSPAGGVEYSTESQSGVTDEYGRFSYKAGELVNFTVGTFDLGTAPAADTVYLFDLNGLGDPFDATTRNKVRVLLGLDDDQEGANGINISAQFLEVVKGWPVFDFANDDFSVQRMIDFAHELGDLNGDYRTWPTASQTLRHVTDTLACANGGIYSMPHPDNGNQTLYFIVHPDGLLQMVDLAAMQSAWTNLEFPTVGGEFDYDARPLVQVGLEESGGLAGPYFQPSIELITDFSIDDVILPPISSPLYTDEEIYYFSSLYANQELGGISLPDGYIPENAPDYSFKGAVGTVANDLMISWQGEATRSAVRLLEKPADAIRVIASYLPEAPFLDEAWQQGVVEIVVHADGSAEGVFIDTELMLVSELTIDVDQSDQEAFIRAYGDAGFEANLLLDLDSFTANWTASVVDQPTDSLFIGGVTLVEPSSATSGTPLGVHHHGLAAACR